MQDNALKVFKAIATAAVFAAGTMSVVQAQDVVIASSGGAWQEAQDKALWAPAAEALGITYAQDTFQNWTEVRAQVESGTVNWDIVQISSTDAPLAQAAGILEMLGPDVYNRDDFVPGSSTDYFVANSNYATMIGWNKKTYGEDGPQSMADFFDTEKFPGKRAIWNQPTGVIEAAALALGTPRDQVYEFLSTEEGREAAMAKLAELAPNVGVYWESGAQAAQLVKDGEVDMILAWGGRILGAIDDGADWGYTFNDGLLQTDGYAIVKGAPNRDAAMKFLAEMSQAQYQAHLPDFYGTAPANLKAFEVANYPAEKLATMASAPQNVAVEYPVDPEWWAQYGGWASEAYDQVRLGN